MKIYADYAYYTDTYGGTMCEADFKRLSRKASPYLETVTLGRVRAAAEGIHAEQIKDACCAAADELLTQEQGGEVTSQSVGPWSRQFAGSGKPADKKLYDAVLLYLGSTGLMYRGV